MFARSLAHLSKPIEDLWSGSSGVVACGVVVAIALLVSQHLRVRHGVLRARQFARPVAAICALGLVMTIAPASSSAQPVPVPTGLPDLISDPPYIWYERDLINPQGDFIHVVTFDGMLHNIGEGALDLFGNPQMPGGVKQRIFDGQDWVEVGTPTVRFETDDGHNHFHLISAAQYTLWSADRSDKITDGSKIGFCLVDTFQIEERYDPVYDIDTIKYCNRNEPDSTELSMGITPGWQDVYESSITLQWVDVSDIEPGRYWIGAITDPLDEIVESNDDNNGLVFSSNNWEVSGYVARPLKVQQPGEIVLKSDVYGAVGPRAFVIAEGPENGTLSVPSGFDLLDATVVYEPEPGFEGTDSFTYYAHDTTSAFPRQPTVVTVEVQVEGDAEASAKESTSGLAADAAIVVPNASVSAARFEWISTQLSIDGDDGQVAWFAKDLPAGLTIDPDSGLIEGELTTPGETTSTILASDGVTTLTATIEWSISSVDNVALRQINDISVPPFRRDIIFGTGGGGAVYEATGLPKGTFITSGQPFITGEPEETGTFDVMVNERQGDEIVNSVSFTLTVRPSTKPAFPL